MTRAVLAATSGWGKSWMTQWWTEDNLPNFDRLVVLDYKDEYRGLVKAGYASWAGVGNPEAALEASDWRAFLEENPRVVLARATATERWREACAEVIAAARELGNCLVVVDEAHFVAPERTSYPEEISGLATTGRGELVASMWVTQRLQKLDEDVLAESDVRILGGFGSDADLRKIRKNVGYNADVHDAREDSIRGLPDHLDRDGKPVERFTDEVGSTVGSEWIHSTLEGDSKRINSADKSMTSTHYGAEGIQLSEP